MDERYFTIGMAGHIDHGKTSLTKALTNIDTDRLKEEKERKISIELGFAPLEFKDSSLKVSIIDVPGHERFIRQMIAGVAGIDLVLVIVAADEGVMPQTKEHLDILHLLGIENALIVITKIDRVDPDLIDFVKEDIQLQLADTMYQDSDIVTVDSLSMTGIDQLKGKIENRLKLLPTRDVKGSFRLPIDQVFTVQGQGTVVRGTVYEGSVQKEDRLMLLPKQKQVRARQIQVHKQDVDKAFAGQRAAINLSGIDKADINRGDVLVKSDHFIVTDVVDISLTLTNDVKYDIKQRSMVRLHTGASEVMGKIVFFDRNEVRHDKEEILCQLRLDEPIVTRRGDRFILRRPTPVETIGGGFVIDPQGEKYRFGNETIEMLKQKKEGTPEDHIKQFLIEETWLTKKELIQHTAMDADDLQELLDNMQQREIIKQYYDHYVLSLSIERMQEEAIKALSDFHHEHSLKQGMNKPEFLKTLSYPKKLVDALLDKWEEMKLIKRNGQFIGLADFNPHFPTQWKVRMEKVDADLKQDELQVKDFIEYGEKHGIPASILSDLKSYYLQTNQAIALDDKLIIHKQVFDEAVKRLYKETNGEFSVKDAKEVWGVSRKYLIPLLETLDQLALTKRSENVREWVKEPD